MLNRKGTRRRRRTTKSRSSRKVKSNRRSRGRKVTRRKSKGQKGGEGKKRRTSLKNVVNRMIETQRECLKHHPLKKCKDMEKEFLEWGSKEQRNQRKFKNREGTGDEFWNKLITHVEDIGLKQARAKQDYLAKLLDLQRWNDKVMWGINS